MVIQSQGITIEFPVVSLRRIPSKADTDGQRTYIAVVNVFDLPDLTEWRKINIRDPKLNGAVPKAIRKSLDEDPSSFLFKNRGLVITVNSSKFDTESSKLTLNMEDPNIHGLLDGGHTYKVIKAYGSDVDREEIKTQDQAFVRLEILEGFDSEQIRNIVDARNTSNQVKDQSLMELANSFEGIKKAVAGQPYANKIAYKEYEIMDGTDGKTAKPIDVREVIALMTLFDKDHFGDNNHPVMAYSQKADCLKRYKDNRESYEKILPLLKDILRLWDIIHRDMRSWYEESKAKQGQGAKFGRITGVMPDREAPLDFLGETSTDIIPTAFKYPILAALRAFVEEIDGKYCWGMDVEDALSNDLGMKLTEVLTANAIELRNPNKLGKTSSVWDQCYSKAQVWYLKNKTPKSR
ncbi:MAG: AIPR family protein [Dehalococcoidia bacterium]|nr:AIPR family protein [Dehalococcoidia bacterium]